MDFRTSQGGCFFCSGGFGVHGGLFQADTLAFVRVGWLLLCRRTGVGATDQDQHARNIEDCRGAFHLGQEARNIEDRQGGCLPGPHARKHDLL